MKRKRYFSFGLLILLILTISCLQERNPNVHLAEYISPSELKELAEGISIAYIPIGAMEWHNDHLPIGYDTIKAFELCKRICSKTGGVIFPPIYFGTNTIGTEGSMPITPELTEELFRSVIKNLIDQGFRVIVTLTGHTPKIQMDILKKLAHEAVAENRYIRVIPLTEGTFVHDEEIELFGHYQDHAAAGETSLFLAMRPDLVHLDRLKYPKKPKKEGVLWDPRYGSRENGEKIVNLIVQRSAAHIMKERKLLFARYPEAPKPVQKVMNGASILDEMK